MPEKTLKKLNTHILPELKVCFFAAVIASLLAHTYKITNWLPNWDSLVFRYDSQNMLGLGRWFLPVVCSFTSFYDLPFLNGIVSILFHALGAVVICKVLGVKEKMTAGLIGAVIASFPTVTSVMMYNYVADGYSISFFLAVLAAFCMTGKKQKVILPAVLIALSTGIYQAYITVTITLVLFHLIYEVIFNDASFRAVLKKGGLMLLSGVIGMALYGGILKAALAIFSAELLDYQGAAATASLSNINLHASLYVAKQTFLDFFFSLSQGVSVYFILNVLICVFTIAFYLKCIIENKIYKKPQRALVLAALCIMLIFGAGALAFINAEVDYHNLMLMGYSVFYLFFLMIYEKGKEKTEKKTAIKRWAVLILAVLVTANQVVLANVSYHKARIAYERSYGVLIRIADRIEQTPHSQDCEKLLVIGALENSEAYSVDLAPDITGITDGYIIRADDETVGQSVLCSAINDYCDKNYAFISGDEKKALMEREEIKALEIWPSENCIAVAEDIIVIKLSAEDEK